MPQYLTRSLSMALEVVLLSRCASVVQPCYRVFGKAQQAPA
jgi:hypothetical protein